MEEIDLKDLVSVFWNKKKLILIIISVCLVIGGMFNLFYKKDTITYTANTTIIITKKMNEKEDKNSIISEKNIVMSLVKSDIVLEEINTRLNLKVNKDDISFDDKVDNILEINVANENKQNAIDISNIIIEKLQSEIFSVLKNNDIELEVVNFPDKTCFENSEKNIIDLLIFVLISIILSFGVVFVIYIFDTTIKSKENIEKELDISVIDELKLMKKENNSIENELTTIFDFKSENSKIFKIIVTKILNKINTNEQNVLLITSPNSSEGKTYVASNIGTVLAMFGKKVIILDTNFENSKLDKIFKVPNSLGVSNYLTGINGNGQEIKETLNNFIQETDIKNLNVITAGDVKENITNCLVSERFDEFIKQLKFYYDFIIIDSEKLTNTPNSLILSNKANNTIVVVDRNSTKVEELIKASNNIKEVNGKLLGVIINETLKKNCMKEKIENFKNNTMEKLKRNNNKMLEENFDKE